MSDEFTAWDGGAEFADGGYIDFSSDSYYDAVQYEPTEGGGTIFILPNGEPAHEGASGGSGGELEYGPGTATLQSLAGSEQVASVAEEAEELLEGALVEGSGVEEEILETTPAEEDVIVGGGESTTPTPTPGPVVYYEDPRIDDLYAVVVQMDQRDAEVLKHYHNVELIGTSLVGLISMAVGGCVAYAFLRRIFI